MKGKPPEVPLRSDFVAKVQVEKSGMKEVKFDVNTEAMEGSGVKEVMQLDGLTMMKNEQSCWPTGTLVNLSTPRPTRRCWTRRRRRSL